MTDPITDPTDDFNSTTAIPLPGSGLDTGASMRPSMNDRALGVDPTNRAAGVRDRVHQMAGMVHQAIDKLEQTLSSRSEGVTSVQSVYRERATQYGEQLRTQGDRVRDRVGAQPLQAIGVAMLAGFVFGKLFMRSPKVRTAAPRVVQTRPLVTFESPERPARRWRDAAGSGMRDLRTSGEETAALARVNAAARLDRVKAMTAALAQAASDRASTLPLQLRLATERLRANSRAYGGVAKSTVQAHPMIGVGTVLGSVALLTTMWLRRRQATDSAYVAVDAKGHGVAWKHADQFDSSSGGALAMLTDRPVASAAVALGIGALVAALLRR